MTREEFLEKARAVHGDKYEYPSFGDVVKSKDYIDIMCPKHGMFRQNVRAHYRGNGCPTCSKDAVTRAAHSRVSSETVINRLRSVLGDSCDYSKVKYVDTETKVTIICPKHGEYEKTPHEIARGNCRCPRCSHENAGINMRYGIDKFVDMSRNVHGNKYDYSMVVLNGRLSDGKVTIICPKHGEFEQSPLKHIHGQGCPLCANERRTLLGRKDTADFINEATRLFDGKYDYSQVTYVNNKTKVKVVCPLHGVFEITPNSHLGGEGCHMCGRERTRAKISSNTEKFIERAKEVHGDKYAYDNSRYVNSHTKLLVTCHKHGDFPVTPINHVSCKSGCPKCSNPISRPEIEVREFLASLGINYVVNDRKTLGGHEIDIFIPDKMIGIEFDGIRWHNELYKDKEYHLEKTLECSKHGVRLLHIFEDEWLYKKEIWMSMLKNILGISAEKIYARKCEVRTVSPMEKTSFLNDNHIQGNVNTAVNLGLYYNGELVSLMTFNKQRINLGGKKCDGYYELSRFCSKLNTIVVGGASRLFRKFITEYKPLEVVSYSDRRWSLGNLYVMLGFDFSHFSRPNYYYVVNDIRENRFKYRKDRLVAEGFDPSKTEHEIMLERKIYRIYDCGTMVWKWKSDSSTSVS